MTCALVGPARLCTDEAILDVNPRIKVLVKVEEHIEGAARALSKKRLDAVVV